MFILQITRHDSINLFNKQVVLNLQLDMTQLTY